ncbi:MAG: hypothetical protein JWM56_260 [Candidatus Peribacteria bacterium]|nr:hypothetical protein [Candidatus Peribacteria bacterium]
MNILSFFRKKSPEEPPPLKIHCPAFIVVSKEQVREDVWRVITQSPDGKIRNQRVWTPSDEFQRQWNAGD